MLLRSWGDDLASLQPVWHLVSELERLGLGPERGELLRVLVQRHPCEDDQAFAFPEVAGQLQEH